jgi:hypothetical protein
MNRQNKIQFLHEVFNSGNLTAIDKAPKESKVLFFQHDLLGKRIVDKGDGSAVMVYNHSESEKQALIEQDKKKYQVSIINIVRHDEQ